MTFRIAFVAVLITVLASACNNKTWIDCPTTTTIRTKNRALTSPQAIVDQGQTEALTC